MKANRFISGSPGRIGCNSRGSLVAHRGLEAATQHRLQLSAQPKAKSQEVVAPCSTASASPRSPSKSAQQLRVAHLRQRIDRGSMLLSSRSTKSALPSIRRRDQRADERQADRSAWRREPQHAKPAIEMMYSQLQQRHHAERGETPLLTRITVGYMRLCGRAVSRCRGGR